jgi:hypothetical protein
MLKSFHIQLKGTCVFEKSLVFYLLSQIALGLPLVGQSCTKKRLDELLGIKKCEAACRK